MQTCAFLHDIHVSRKLLQGGKLPFKHWHRSAGCRSKISDRKERFTRDRSRCIWFQHVDLWACNLLCLAESPEAAAPLFAFYPSLNRPHLLLCKSLLFAIMSHTHTVNLKGSLLSSVQWRQICSKTPSGHRTTRVRISLQPSNTTEDFTDSLKSALLSVHFIGSRLLSETPNKYISEGVFSQFWNGFRHKRALVTLQRALCKASRQVNHTAMPPGVSSLFSGTCSYINSPPRWISYKLPARG